MGSTIQPPSQLHLLPAHISDCPEMVDLFDTAFKEDPNFTHFYPNVSSADRAIVRERDIKTYERSFGQEEMRFFKIVDAENGKIAAFSKWEFPHIKSPERRLADEEVKKNRAPHVPGANGPFLDEFFGKLIAGRKKYIVEENMYFLNILAVHPQYQRRGLGSRLIEPVLALADAEGRRTYIEASRKGVRLYERYGWVRVDAVVMDTRPFGGESLEETVLLLREPRQLADENVEAKAV